VISRKIRHLCRTILITLPFFFLNTLALLHSKALSKVAVRFSDEWSDFQNLQLENTVTNVTHRTSYQQNLSISIHTPNKICGFRARSISTKEPDTLQWLEKYRFCETFFDIGANIGIFSIYFAKISPGKVVAFEPSPMNIASLTRNICLNNFSEQISIFTLPLSNLTRENRFNLGSLETGAALSSFGVNYGWDGKPLSPSASFNTLGLSLDDFVSLGGRKVIPNIIKLDVDGIEPLILEGAQEILANKKLKSVLVEVNENFESNRDRVFETLSTNGFELNLAFKGNNQVWERI
jgi:FkbM family methyltransferase